MKIKNTCSLALAVLGACASSLAQGTVYFTNRAPGEGLNTKFVDCDMVTPLAGPAWLAQLYAGPVGTSEGRLRPVGAPVAFRTGSLAGYFSGGEVTIPDIPPGGPAVVQVRMWEAAAGPCYEAAVAECKKRYRSALLLLPATGNPTLSPPGIPVYLVGLQASYLLCGCQCFNMCVPFRCSIVRDGDHVVITWSALHGMYPGEWCETYALMRADALTGTWEIISTQSAMGGTMSASVRIADAAGFFRVQALRPPP